MKLEEVLKNSGLSEKQSQVYLALLQIGPSSCQKIAKKASLPRSTVYEVLENLVHLGFVNTYNKKQVRYFNAEEPDMIIRLAQARVDTLKDALPELDALVGKSRKRPSVRFYQGREQMRLILDEILKEADELVCFGVSEDWLKIQGDYHEKFLNRRMKNKIPLRIILKESEIARERQEAGTQELRQAKIVSAKFDFHGLTYVWKNKIAMFSLINDYVAVITESQELADMQKAMFNNLWSLLP